MKSLDEIINSHQIVVPPIEQPKNGNRASRRANMKGKGKKVPIVRGDAGSTTITFDTLQKAMDRIHNKGADYTDIWFAGKWPEPKGELEPETPEEYAKRETAYIAESKLAKGPAMMPRPKDRK